MSKKFELVSLVRVRVKSTKNFLNNERVIDQLIKFLPIYWKQRKCSILNYINFIDNRQMSYYINLKRVEIEEAQIR